MLPCRRRRPTSADRFSKIAPGAKKLVGRPIFIYDNGNFYQICRFGSNIVGRRRFGIIGRRRWSPTWKPRLSNINLKPWTTLKTNSQLKNCEKKLRNILVKLWDNFCKQNGFFRQSSWKFGQKLSWKQFGPSTLH